MKTFEQFMTESKYVVYHDSKDGPMYLNTITGELLPVDPKRADAYGTSIKDFLLEPGVVFNSAKEIKKAAEKNSALASVLRKSYTKIGKLK